MTSAVEEDTLSLLKDRPDFDVNIGKFGRWPLHFASCRGLVEVVKRLLALPNIDVNVKDTGGQTPFSLACQNGHVGVVQLLLKDPRVDVTLDDNDSCTSLWWAVRNGGLEVIEWLIASDRVAHCKWQRFGRARKGKAYEMARK